MPLGAPSPPVLGAEAAPRGLWRPVVVGWFLAPPCVSSVPRAPAVRNGDNDAYPTGLLSRSGQIHSFLHSPCIQYWWRAPAGAGTWGTSENEAGLPAAGADLLA